MLVAFLTSDLVFPSRVAGIVQRRGGTMVTAATIDALVARLSADELSEQSLDKLLVDLSSPGVDPSAIMTRLDDLPHRPQATIAFGPHVHEARLAAAKAAGFDVVLTRGQFDAQMDRLISADATGS